MRADGVRFDPDGLKALSAWLSGRIKTGSPRELLARRTLASQGASPQPASPHFLPKGSKAAPSDLADKDRQIVAAFKRRGFSVTLMDRNDPKLPYDVRPYKGWLDVGRVVRKGQRGVRGLFHLTQTDALPSATPPKGKKAKLHAVKS